MNCNDYQDLLIELQLGNLPEPIELDVRGHLLVCAACGREAERLKRVHDAAAALPEVEPSAGLRDRILVHYHQERKRSYSDRLRAIAVRGSFAGYFLQWSLLQLRRPAGAAVAAGLVLILSVAAWSVLFRPAVGTLPDAAIERLPETAEVTESAGRRLSVAGRLARDELERQLAALETLDVPEQAWRNVEPEYDTAAIKEIEPRIENIEVVQVRRSDLAAMADTAIAGTDRRTERPLFGNRFALGRTLAYYEGEDIRGFIERGLKWLVNRQNEDGSWGPESCRAFTTALAGMCLLADIDVLDVLGYREALDKAAAYVRRGGSQSGFYGGEDRDNRRGHVAALTFLVEYAALAGRTGLEDEISRGLQRTFEMGNVKGWETIESQFSADSAVIGWYILLIESARSAGFTVDRMYIDRARAWVTMATYGGKEGVPETDTFKEDDYTKAAIAFMGRYFLGDKLDKKDVPAIAKDMVAYLDEQVKRNSRDINPYFLHFAALGLFQNHGKEWYVFHWNVKNLLAGSGIADTYFGEDRGTCWPAKDRRYAPNGDTFYTAMAVLTLQTYYRYKIIQ